MDKARSPPEPTMRRTRLLDATRDLVWHTEALAAQFARARARAAARSGISESQHRVLRTIASSSYCLSLSDLARQLRISPQASQRNRCETRCARPVVNDAKSRRSANYPG